LKRGTIFSDVLRSEPLVAIAKFLFPLANRRRRTVTDTRGAAASSDRKGREGSHRKNYADDHCRERKYSNDQILGQQEPCQQSDANDEPEDAEPQSVEGGEVGGLTPHTASERGIIRIEILLDLLEYPLFAIG
jgi:hypothetical protein